MKRLYIGLILLSGFLCISSNRAKRFTGSDQRGNNEWSWGRSEQLTDGQTKGSSANWPSKGSGGSTKGRGDANPNRDGSWGSDGWSSSENRNDGYDMEWNTQPQGNNKGSAYPDGEGEQAGDLETLLRGVPGMDFPNFVSIPKTDFDCSRQPSQGYYGDVEAGCQVFHICQPGNRKDSFLCPVGTIFNQKYFVCDWWFNVNCNDTPSFYDLNNEVYKEVPAVTEEVLVTTEKTLPWNSQDLDKKRPTKGWGTQSPTGKQNPRWNDTPNTPTRRGSKSDSVSTSREVSNSWSRSDVQQKEVTLSWGASSGTSSAVFGSSSTSSNSFIPTTKPIWYGIDGQPAKDQSNGMTKRTGLAQTPAPFGTRMRSSATMGIANTWPTTEVYEKTTLPMNGNSYDTAVSKNWLKGDVTVSPLPITKSWRNAKNIGDTAKARNINGDSNYSYTTQKVWLKSDDIPETSINPTGVKGVWEQQTTRRSDQGEQNNANTVGHKGFVTKSDSSNRIGRKFQAPTNERKEWGRRQIFKNSHSSTATNRAWVMNNYEKQKLIEESNINSIPRRKSWQSK